MTKALPSDSVAITKSPEEIEREKQLMANVQLVLYSLFEREKVTVKQILGYLYDVGAINLINQKVPCRLLNQPAKAIARCSKPVFKTVGWAWFIKNCPQLLTGWLHSKVRFESEPPPPMETVEAAIVPTEGAIAPTAIQPAIVEVQRLRAQVRLLTGALVTTATVLVATLVWVSQAPRMQPTLTEESRQFPKPSLILEESKR